MRQILAICLMLSLLAQNSGRIFIIADYYVNTAAYAKNCINKTNPGMRCNGKCQMMKKIFQEEKKDQENTERRENLKNEVLSSKSFFASMASPDFRSGPSINTIFASNTNTIDRCFDIFHPPQA
jgi:hypothetical protein